jgi:hypothetical protein
MNACLGHQRRVRALKEQGWAVDRARPDPPEISTKDELRDLHAPSSHTVLSARAHLGRDLTRRGLRRRHRRRPGLPSEQRGRSCPRLRCRRRARPRTEPPGGRERRHGSPASRAPRGESDPVRTCRPRGRSLGALPGRPRGMAGVRLPPRGGPGTTRCRALPPRTRPRRRTGSSGRRSRDLRAARRPAAGYRERRVARAYILREPAGRWLRRTDLTGGACVSRRACRPRTGLPSFGFRQALQTPESPFLGKRRDCGALGYFSGFFPAIQMMTRVNLPSPSTSKKLQLCMSFFVPSLSSPM